MSSQAMSPCKQAKVTRVLSAKQKLASLQRLKEIRAALEDAITEQQAKPPSGDSKADHQHQQDWQPNVLPRDLALERAGYMDLCMMIRGYKQMAGGPASVPTRQFVADALGYCLAGAVQKKADPAQVGKDVWLGYIEDQDVLVVSWPMLLAYTPCQDMLALFFS